MENENAPTPAMHLQGVPIMTETPAGAAFAARALHPPGPRPSAYSGIPDGSSGSVVTVPLLGQTNVAPIFQYNSGTVIAPVKVVTNPSDILMLVTPSAKVGVHVFSRVGASAWAQQTALNLTTDMVPQPSVVATGPYNFNQNFGSDVAQFRLAGKSTTVELNATQFNNQGTVTVAKFSPTVLNTTSGSSVATTREWLTHLPADQHEAFLHMAQRGRERRRHEVTMVHRTRDPSIEVIDDIDAQVFNYTYQIVDLGNFASGAIINTGFGGNVAISNVFPNSMSEVLNSSTNSTTRPLREGAFVVMNKNTQNYDWVIPPSSTAVTVPQLGLVRSAVRFFNGTTAQFLELSSGMLTSGLDTANLVDTPWTQFEWAWILCSGMTVPSAPTSSLSGLPYLTIKSVLDFEFRPNFASSQIVHQRRLPVEDRQALYMVSKVNSERPDSLPASANSLGTIAATVMKYIPSAVSMLKGLFGSKSAQNTQMSKISNFVAPAARETRPPRAKPVVSAKPINQAINRDKTRIAALEKQLAALKVVKKSTSVRGQPLKRYLSKPPKLAVTA